MHILLYEAQTCPVSPFLAFSPPLLCVGHFSAQTPPSCSWHAVERIDFFRLALQDLRTCQAAAAIGAVSEPCHLIRHIQADLFCLRLCSKEIEEAVVAAAIADRTNFLAEMRKAPCEMLGSHTQEVVLA